jgi:hypothetical protein
MAKKITLNQYLSVFNRDRKMDKIFIKWFQKKDKSNPSKKKEDWDKIINYFWNETENKTK